MRHICQSAANSETIYMLNKIETLLAPIEKKIIFLHLIVSELLSSQKRYGRVGSGRVTSFIKITRLLLTIE